jgi:uncharacterized protein involved in exopolysaccharide biosynthesis
MTSPTERPQTLPEQREMSVYDVLNALLLHRGLVIGLPLLFFVLAAGYSLSQARTWTSGASFMPQGGSNGGSWAGMAAQMGVQIGGRDAGESPAFYAQLIRSRAILGATLDSSFVATHADGRQVTAPLREILVRRGESAHALVLLDGAVSVSTERETGIIHVGVTTEDPQLSRAVNATLLALVNEFNLEKRQLQAAAERRFVESRLAEARVELFEAESTLQRFEETNRRIESPHLVLARGRLQHEVGLRQQLVSTLAESFERARIDEVRNLPLITVVDAPELPFRPDGRGTVFRSLFALLLGFFVAAAIALARTSLGTQASARPDARLFRQLRQEAAQQAAQPFRRIIRVFRAAPAGAANGGSATTSSAPARRTTPEES